MLLSFYTQDHLIRKPVDKVAMQKTENLKREFIELHPGVMRFSPADLPQVSRNKDLVDPAQTLPRFHQYGYAQVQVLHRGSKTCEWPRGLQNLHNDLQKSVVWQQFLCKQISHLPKGFMNLRPFVDVSGFSYVYLAAQSGLAQFQDPAWLSGALGRAHVLEIKPLSKNLRLSKREQLMAELDSKDWGLILDGALAVLSNNYVLFRISSRPGVSTSYPIYQVFHRSNWNEFLAGTGFSTTEEISGFTVRQEGELAWESTLSLSDSLSRKYRYLALASVILLGLNLIHLTIREIRRRVKDQQQRLLILQTLTHELRTPVAAMQLSLEPFRSHFDDLSGENQQAFFQMTQGMHRLKRVIEASTQYLRSDSTMGDIQFQVQNCESVNDFFQELILEQSLKDPDQVEFQGLEPDQGFSMDPYCVRVVMQNLLDNALKHGVLPVKLGLKLDSGQLTILVQDQGALSKSDFLDALDPFSRKGQGEGLGLGLTLVEKIISQMGGKLEFEENPTRVRVRILEKKSEEVGRRN